MFLASSRVAVVSGLLSLPSSSAQTWPCSLPCQVLSVLPLWSWVLACCALHCNDMLYRMDVDHETQTLTYLLTYLLASYLFIYLLTCSDNALRGLL